MWKPQQVLIVFAKEVIRKQLFDLFICHQFNIEALKLVEMSSNSMSNFRQIEISMNIEKGKWTETKFMVEGKREKPQQFLIILRNEAIRKPDFDSISLFATNLTYNPYW